MIDTFEVTSPAPNGMEGQGFDLTPERARALGYIGNGHLCWC